MQGGLLHRSHAILMVLTPPPVEASGGQEQYSHQVTLTFGEPLGQADIQSDIPPVEASGGQEQYYVRSA